VSRDFKSFMVYTTEEGGIMKVWWATRETYEEAKRTGRLDIAPKHSENPPEEWVDLAMVAFAPLEELHDFV